MTELNVYLTSYFGPLSLTVPINVILFGFLLTRIRASFTKANVFFGFLLLTLALMGLFQSGQVGEKIFQISNSIFGSILTILLFAAATLVGLVVFLNLSLGQVFEGIKGMFKLLSILINKISPLFKSKKQFAVSNMKQITIKGLKEEEINKEPPRPLPKAKKGEMADTLVLNKPLEMGVWEYPPLSLLSVHAGKRDTGDVKKITAIIERTLQSFGIQSRVS